MIAYLDMRVLEQTNPCSKGNSLAIGWDKLIDRATSAGEFMKKYPSSDRVYDAKRLYEGYQRIIFGIGNISPFDEKTKELKVDVKKVFETSISNNPNSEFTKKLKEFLNVVSQNGNKENERVNDFRWKTVFGMLKQRK